MLLLTPQLTPLDLTLPAVRFSLQLPRTVCIVYCCSCAYTRADHRHRYNEGQSGYNCVAS